MVDFVRIDVVMIWFWMRGNGDIGIVIKYFLFFVVVIFGFYVLIVNFEGFLLMIYSFVDYLLVCCNLYLVLVCFNV